MVWTLRTIATVIAGLALFTIAMNVFCSALPAWLLVLIGFIGGNTIVSLCVLTFAEEWWIERVSSVV